MTRYVIVAAAAILCVTGEIAGKRLEHVKCKSTLNRFSCPKGTYYRENVKSMGYCPGCVQLQEFHGKCITSEECAPGLKCSETERKCILDERQKCGYYKLNDPVWTNTKYWNPNCLPNGQFYRKQCKGDMFAGKCFCSDENGNRLFGEEEWSKAENMTCACSHLAAELKATKPESSLHCDDYGNFEQLQCNDKVCWCSNERTGIPYTIVVPESMIRVLPCFDEEEMGSQYLRRCESIEVNTALAEKFMIVHGTTFALLNRARCNYDGSYARVQTLANRQYCTYKNHLNVTERTEQKTDCNCAYDRFVEINLKGKNFNLECDGNGSYRRKQYVNNLPFYIDQDGFFYGFKDYEKS